MAALATAFSNFQTFGQNAVHGSNRAQVSPFVQQLRPYGGRSFVDKLSAVQDLHNGFPFGRAQGAWGCGPRPRIQRRPFAPKFLPIQTRWRQIQSLTAGTDSVGL